MNASRTWLLALVLVAVSWVTTSCSAPPKPEELAELDRIWADPATRAIKDIPGAKRYYEDAYDMRLRARQAYDDGDSDKAREYAIWSILKYRTAESFAKQHEAKERLESFNAKVRGVVPELERINAERNKLVAEVAALQQKINVAKRRAADSKARDNAMNTSTYNPGDSNSAELRKEVNTLLREADTAKVKADAVEASKFAASSYNQAVNNIKGIRTMLANGTKANQAMMDSAREAVRLFTKSAAAAKPDYDRFKLKQNGSLRNANLLKQARSSFGADFAMSEGNGVRVILASLYNRKESDFSLGTDGMLRAAVKLAKEYDEYDILIEGFTSGRGNATDNLTISQNRAIKMRDHLVSKGVDKGRTRTKGLGGDRLRYSRKSDKNDRVELVFRRK